MGFETAAFDRSATSPVTEDKQFFPHPIKEKARFPPNGILTNKRPLSRPLKTGAGNSEFIMEILCRGS
jgi:hypothetical protein